ncbi:HlyD family secretion protein [Candidatus Burkholderia verschuerenii]|uniref:HlyD family secretion protein n=1 Tax=Candidatus Burkholderia verschuerenii TaxID=242163 RepID=UPI00067C87E3|nr:HlyD family efflux transporter periplasmic adaptor subunit [Candidatus Burkholderia verschuerenii]
MRGEILLTRSLSLWAITALLVAITSTLALWAALGSYARIETVPGALIPDGVLSKVYSDKPGRVVWLGVREGDVVRRGQPLATVQVEQNLANGHSPNDERLASVAEQARLTKSELRYEGDRTATERARLERLLDELGQERGVLDAQLVLQKQAVASTRSSFDAITPLVEKGFETKSDYERRRQEWLTTATQLQTLIQQISQLVQRRSQAESELAKLPVEHASKVADLHNSLSELDQRRIDIEGAKSFLITAPVAGRVTAVQAMPGRSSDGRLPMLSIVLEGARMQAILFAPSRAIGMARPGQEVRLMYDAFPYQRFGSSTGRILAISHSVLAPDEVDAPVRLQEPVYEMRVAIEKQSVEAFGQALPLQPGMTLNADVVLDKRSFLDWVLEPLRAVRNRG